MRSTRLRVLLVGAALIILMQAAQAVFIAGRAADAAVEREAEVAQEFLNSILRAQKSPAELFAPAGPSPALTALSGQIANLPGLIRANVYSPDGIIRYSTQENLIGVRFEEHNRELEESFAGRLVADLESLARDSKAEHLALPLKPGESFIEAYVPISGEDGKPVAVVELYKRPAGLAGKISGLTRSVWFSTGLAAISLFAALAVCLFLRPRGRTG